MTKPAGELDQLVTLRRRATNPDGTPIVDALGQAAPPWLDAGPAFARIRHLRGGEAVAAAAHTDGEVIEVHIRQRPAIDPTWAFAWRARHWDILSMLPVTGTQDLRLIATSGGKVNPR